MPNDPSITWNTSGRRLNQPDDEKPSISVTEHPQSFSMGDTPGPFGIPVDAPLAVTMIKALREKVKNLPPENELKRMLEGSFAITFDKNVLLKTISQPLCEGIRFYLALKKGEKGEELLTLVTVGVDANGRDLLYEYQAGTPVENIPTRSLLAEYGFPPGVLQQDQATLDPFVLFRLSE